MTNACVWAFEGQSVSLGYFVRVAMNLSETIIFNVCNLLICYHTFV